MFYLSFVDRQYSKCLKFELLKSKLVLNPNFCEFKSKTPLCGWKPNFGLTFQIFPKCPKFELFGNRTVMECLKSILVPISDTHCILFLSLWLCLPVFLFFSACHVMSTCLLIYTCSLFLSFYLSSFLSLYFFCLFVPFFLIIGYLTLHFYLGKSSGHDTCVILNNSITDKHLGRH